tara:strand:- start:8633 stop:10852 length:2220 start_codon:yes stop_codon:yes gene_type:complete
MARYNTAPQTLVVDEETTFTYAFTGGIISLIGTTGYEVTMVSPVFFPGSRQTFYNATDGMITISTAAGQITGNGVTLGTSVDIPTNSTYTITSDGANYVLTSALAGTTVFELPLTTNALLNADGKVELNPLDNNVEIKPTGSGTVDISPQSSVSIQPGAQATVRPTGDLTLASASGSVNIGEAGKPTSFPGNLDFSAAGQTINLSPTGVSSSVTVDPGGDTIIGAGGTLTISSDTEGSMSNVRIGATNPTQANFTSLGATGAVTFTANTASSSTTSGTLVVTGGLGVSGAIFGGSLQGTAVGSSTASTGAFTTLASNGATTFTANTASTNTTTGTLVVTGGIGLSGALFAGSINNTPIGSSTANTGAFTTLTANSTVDITGTTEATNNSGDTGVLRVEGGASIAKRVYSGGGFVGPIGNVATSTGQFSTLSATSTVGFSPANANITLSPSGTGTVTVSPAGGGSINNMSVGATTASTGNFSSLGVTGNLDVARYIRHTGDTNTYIDFEGDTISFYTGGEREITINTSGVRLGDTGNGYLRQVSGNYGSIEVDGGAHGGWEGYNIGGRAVFMHDNSNTLGLYDDVNNEWAYRYVYNGASYLYNNGGIKLETQSDGCQTTGIHRASGNVISNTSDARLKTNIENIPNALDKVMSLNGVTYNWNENTPEEFDKERAEVGLIAQEVQAVLPEIIHNAPFDRGEDGTSISGKDYITLQYERVVPLLVEAIKELKEEINTLKGDA